MLIKNEEFGVLERDTFSQIGNYWRWNEEDGDGSLIEKSKTVWPNNSSWERAWIVQDSYWQTEHESDLKK